MAKSDIKQKALQLEVTFYPINDSLKLVFSQGKFLLFQNCSLSLKKCLQGKDVLRQKCSFQRPLPKSERLVLERSCYYKILPEQEKFLCYVCKKGFIFLNDEYYLDLIGTNKNVIQYPRIGRNKKANTLFLGGISMNNEISFNLGSTKLSLSHIIFIFT